jgi:hypothetical protein
MTKGSLETEELDPPLDGQEEVYASLWERFPSAARNCCSAVFAPACNPRLDIGRSIFLEYRLKHVERWLVKADVALASE